MEMLITVAILVIIIYLIYYLATRNLRYFQKLDIPYVPGKPITGSYSNRKHMSESIMKVYNAYPDAKYVGAFDMIRPIIMIRDRELIKNVAIKNFDCFTDHQMFVDKDVDPLFGRNLFTSRGEIWRELRNMVSPAFTSSKMKAMSVLIIDIAKNFVKSMAELPLDVKEMTDTRNLFSKFTNDAIATCAFGISVDSLKEPTNEFFVRSKHVSNFSTTKAMFKFLFARMCPWVMKLLKIQLVDDESTKFFINLVKSSIKEREEKGINRPDMIQLLMNARDKANGLVKLDYVDMTAQSMIFIFGGLGTTSAQMCIVAHELALNNDIQTRLQEEIDQVMKNSNGDPSYELINKMPYLDAVFNESLRRHSPIQTLDRICVKPFELPPSLPGGKPLTLQPGMGIWIPAVGIHRDPKYYENPEKFDPDRYYQKKVTINDTENLGFGIGPRGCPGNRFAIMETKILFFYLLQYFKLVPNAKTLPLDSYDSSTFEVRPKGGFWLSIESRKSAD